MLGQVRVVLRPRDAIAQQKARLPFEDGANSTLTPNAEPAPLERRSAKIQDELADLDRDDESLRIRIERLRRP